MALARLIVLVQPGCEECERTEPMVEEFKKRNPGVQTSVRDITKGDWPLDFWEPAVTPTFLVRGIRSGSRGPVQVKEGAFSSYKRLSEWVLGKL